MTKSSTERQREYVARMRALGLTQLKVWVAAGDQVRVELREIERREIEKARAQAAESKGQMNMFESG